MNYCKLLAQGEVRIMTFGTLILTYQAFQLEVILLYSEKWSLLGLQQQIESQPWKLISINFEFESKNCS